MVEEGGSKDGKDGRKGSKTEVVKKKVLLGKDYKENISSWGKVRKLGERNRQRKLALLGRDSAQASCSLRRSRLTCFASSWSSKRPFEVISLWTHLMIQRLARTKLFDFQLFQIGHKLPAFIRSSSFKLPQDPTKPVSSSSSFFSSLSSFISSLLTSFLSLAGDHDSLRWSWLLLEAASLRSEASGKSGVDKQTLIPSWSGSPTSTVGEPDYSHLDPPSAIILQSEAQAGISVGPMILIFGCRRESMDLLRKETDKLGFAIFSFLMQRIFVFLMFM